MKISSALKSIVCRTESLGGGGVTQSKQYIKSRGLRMGRVAGVLAMSLSAVASSIGATWYVDNSASGSKNGTSWANAWPSFASISWGGAGVNPGDTVFISGGSVSKTYSETLSVGIAGTATSRIHVRVGQDAGHNGKVILKGGNGINCQRSYVTINGEYNGSRNLVLNGCYVELASSVDPVLRYVDVSGVGIGVNATYGSRGEFAFNKIWNITTEAAMRLNARNNGVASYDQTLIHDNEIQVNGQINNGTGPDGIQTGWGVSFYNNNITAVPGAVSGGQHQDLIQTFGTMYHKIYNNTFTNSGDSMVGMDFTGSPAGHIRIWNNIFRDTIADMGTTAIRFYSSKVSISAWADILIDNNTFVDKALQSGYGAAIQVSAISGSASATNCAIRNNIFYNCGRKYQVIQINNTAPGFVIDYNLLNAGAHGNTSILYSGFSGQAHPQSGVPKFVVYAEGGTGNNYHLQGSDTSCIDKGVTLQNFSTDKDGAARGGVWDIGAFEYVGTTEQPPASPGNLRVVAP